MEIDWEVEIGAGAPVIDALWSGFIDLRRFPERVGELAEVTLFPPLGELLLAANAAPSAFWSAKCDVWEMEPEELAALRSEEGESPSAGWASYLDLLPSQGVVFADWKQAEACCRELVRRLEPVELSGCQLELVVRRAIAGERDGCGVTAYTCGFDSDKAKAGEHLQDAFAALAHALCSVETSLDRDERVLPGSY